MERAPMWVMRQGEHRVDYERKVPADSLKLEDISPNTTKQKANMTFSNAVARPRSHPRSHCSPSSVMRASSTLRSSFRISSSFHKPWAWRS